MCIVYNIVPVIVFLSNEIKFFSCQCTFLALLCVAWITNLMRIMISIQTNPMHNMNYVDPFWRNELVLVFLCFTLHTMRAYILTDNHIIGRTTATMSGMEPFSSLVLRTKWTPWFLHCRTGDTNEQLGVWLHWLETVFEHGKDVCVDIKWICNKGLHTSSAHQQRVLGPNAVTPRSLFNHSLFDCLMRQTIT